MKCGTWNQSIRSCKSTYGHGGNKSVAQSLKRWLHSLKVLSNVSTSTTSSTTTLSSCLSKTRSTTVPQQRSAGATELLTGVTNCYLHVFVNCLFLLLLLRAERQWTLRTIIRWEKKASADVNDYATSNNWSRIAKKTVSLIWYAYGQNGSVGENIIQLTENNWQCSARIYCNCYSI